MSEANLSWTGISIEVFTLPEQEYESLCRAFKVGVCVSSGKILGAMSDSFDQDFPSFNMLSWFRFQGLCEGKDDISAEEDDTEESESDQCLEENENLLEDLDISSANETILDIAEVRSRIMVLQPIAGKHRRVSFRTRFMANNLMIAVRRCLKSAIFDPGRVPPS